MGKEIIGKTILPQDIYINAKEKISKRKQNMLENMTPEILQSFELYMKARKKA